MSQFQPRNQGLVIRPLEKISESASGLAIPEEKRRVVDRPSSGEVISTGPDCQWVKEGMHVYFDKYKCIEITDHENNEALGAIIEADIFGEVL